MSKFWRFFAPKEIFKHLMYFFHQRFIWGWERHKTWVIFDNSKLLIIVILPIWVRNLGVHIRIKLLMSPILLLTFILVISAMLLTSNWIPKDVNLFVQSSSKSRQKIALLSLHAPILTTLFFSTEIHLNLHTLSERIFLRCNEQSGISCILRNLLHYSTPTVSSPLIFWLFCINSDQISAAITKK